MKPSERNVAFRVEPGPTPWRNDGDTEPIRYGGRTDDDCGTENVRKGIFRNNRGLLITLIDLCFVSVLLVVYAVILRPLADRVTIEPYVIDLEATEDGETVVIIGTTSVLRPVFRPSPELPRERPIVTLSAGGGSVSDLAPNRGAERTMLLEIPLSAVADAKIEIEATIGDETGTQVLELR